MLLSRTQRVGASAQPNGQTHRPHNNSSAAGYGSRGARSKHRLLTLMRPVMGVALALTAVTVGAVVTSQPGVAQAAQANQSQQDQQDRHVTQVIAAQHAQKARPVNQNCELILPNQPLTANGLATSYQLTAQDAHAGACHEANPQQAAFVQAAILDPTTGALSIYDPLVVDKGTTPAIAPSAPTLPSGAVVAIWFGFNGATLRLHSPNGAFKANHCVNGLGESLFGQVSYCNAAQFFQTANSLIQAGKLSVPALGVARDGQPCPTVRDFAVVDQDQSDNVTTEYLTTSNGKTAQDTAANAAALAGSNALTNASDNRLLSVAMDSALGCTPWQAPDLANGGALTPALPLDELQAAAYQGAPVALTPSGDPMVLRDGRSNLAKQNLYRDGVDQPAETSNAQAAADNLAYCQHLYAIAPTRLLLDRSYFGAQPSPDPALANSLYTFLAQRFVFTFGPQGLGCVKLLRVADPVRLHVNHDGVTTDATIRYPDVTTGSH